MENNSARRRGEFRRAIAPSRGGHIRALEDEDRADNRLCASIANRDCRLEFRPLVCQNQHGLRSARRDAPITHDNVILVDTSREGSLSCICRGSRHPRARPAPRRWLCGLPSKAYLALVAHGKASRLVTDGVDLRQLSDPQAHIVDQIIIQFQRFAHRWSVRATMLRSMRGAK